MYSVNDSFSSTPSHNNNVRNSLIVQQDLNNKTEKVGAAVDKISEKEKIML